MPPRALPYEVSPGDLGLIALPLVLPWSPAADEALSDSFFCPGDLGRLAAVSKALRKVVFFHDVWFKAWPVLAAGVVAVG